MLGLLGLVTATLAVAFLVLPFWSFIRVSRLTREVEALRRRLDAFERGAVRRDAAAPPMPAPQAADAPPPVPSAASMTPPSPGSPAAVAAPEPAARPVAVPAMPPPASVPDDLESRIGGRWLLYTGVAILLIGMSFFLKYAVDNAWIDERGRVALGALAGASLVAAGWRMSASLARFGQALAGTGIGVLYLSVYAALEFYGLIGSGTAFVLMVLITLTASVAADRLASQSLALIAAAGGYLTPFLVSDAEGSATRLFSYDLLLGAGVLALLGRHRWLALPLTAYFLTVLTVAAWAAEEYTGDQWWVLLAFLTAFVLLFVEMRRRVSRLAGSDATVVAAILWSAPVAYHAAAVAVTFDHAPALHTYLIVATAVGVLLTAADMRGWIRLALIVAGYLPLFGFLDNPLGPSWLWPNLVTAVALSGMHVMALVDRVVRQDERWSATDCLSLHVAVIGLFGLLAEMLVPGHAEWRAGAAAVLSIASSGLWFVLAGRDPLAALNAAALAFTMLALSIAVRFEGPVVAIGWAVEGALAAWLGVRAAQPAFRFGGLVLFVLAAGRLAEAYEGGAPDLPVVLNGRTAATAVLVGLAYLLAARWRRREDPGQAEALVPLGLNVMASIFTMTWLSVEIDAYWTSRVDEPQARLSEELMRSLAWGAYGAALVVVGLWRSLVSLRWIGMAAIGLTVLKVFFVDLSELGGIYRVIGFMVVGALLVAVSYLYQRNRTGSAAPPEVGPPPAG